MYFWWYWAYNYSQLHYSIFKNSYERISNGVVCCVSQKKIIYFIHSNNINSHNIFSLPLKLHWLQWENERRRSFSYTNIKSAQFYGMDVGSSVTNARYLGTVSSWWMKLINWRTKWLVHYGNVDSTNQQSNISAISTSLIQVPQASFILMCREKSITIFKL